MTELDVKLSCTKGNFTNDDGEIIAYDIFVIDVNGFPVRIKPADGTAKEILKSALGVK